MVTSCLDCELLLSMQLDDELTMKEQSQLEEHLSQCARCRALQADLRQLHRTSRQLSVPVPDALTAQILRTIQMTEQPVQRNHLRSWLVSAAVLCLLVGGGLWHHWPIQSMHPISGARYSSTYETCEVPSEVRTSVRDIQALGAMHSLTIPLDPLLTREQATEHLMWFFSQDALPEGISYCGFSLSEQVHFFCKTTTTGEHQFYSVSAVDGSVEARFYAPASGLSK